MEAEEVGGVLAMISALIKSGISGAVLTAFFVWAFGMPATWNVFIFWSFISLLVIIVGAVFVVALKWAIIIALIRD